MKQFKSTLQMVLGLILVAIIAAKLMACNDPGSPAPDFDGIALKGKPVTKVHYRIPVNFKLVRDTGRTIITSVEEMNVKALQIYQSGDSTKEFYKDIDIDQKGDTLIIELYK